MGRIFAKILSRLEQERKRAMTADLEMAYERGMTQAFDEVTSIIRRVRDAPDPLGALLQQIHRRRQAHGLDHRR